MDTKVLREAQGLISQAISLVEAVKDDTQEDYDDRSTEWQESAPGQRQDEQLAQLEEVLGNLNQADSDLEAAMKD